MQRSRINYEQTNTLRNYEKLSYFNFNVIYKAYTNAEYGEIIVLYDSGSVLGITNMSYNADKTLINIECYNQETIDYIKANYSAYINDLIIKSDMHLFIPQYYEFQATDMHKFGKTNDLDFINAIRRRETTIRLNNIRDAKDNEEDEMFKKRKKEIEKDKKWISKTDVSLHDLLKYNDLNSEQQENLKTEIQATIGKIGIAAMFVWICLDLFSIKMKGGDPSNLSEKNIKKELLTFNKNDLKTIAEVIKPMVDPKDLKQEIKKLPKDKQDAVEEGIKNYFPGFNLQEDETVFGNLFGKEGGKRRRTNKNRRTNKRRNNKKKSNRR